jgi:hypothetical protein
VQVARGDAAPAQAVRESRRFRRLKSGPRDATRWGMNAELQQIHEHEVVERKRTQLYLVGMLAITAVVVTGLGFAIRWIAVTVAG